jgi:HD-GYP domain-containing protein (c-di-GMP phosphodiesterase class II)
MSASRPWTLWFCLESEVEQALEFLTPLSEMKKFAPADFERLIDTSFETPPHLILAGDALGEIAAAEAAQLLRSQFPTTPLLWISAGQPRFEKSELIKNGASDIFSLIIDRTFLREKIEEHLAKVTQLRAYRKVHLLDLQADSSLPFDISLYLPANQKFICLSSAGDALSGSRLEKLKQHQVRSLHVPLQHMDSFYAYTAEALKKMGAPGSPLSATERQAKMKTAVRNLLSGILGNSSREGTFEEGKEILADCQKIVDQYVKSSPGAGFHQQILQALGEDEGSQAHSGRVSTLAAMLSMGTGIGKPDELAMAGLLHDMGEALLPRELQDRSEDTLSAQELETYKKHVEYTIELVQKRKIILSETLRKCILQHHERWNGTGYPKGISGKLIIPEAQLLGLADEIEQRLCLRQGSKRISPRQAILGIREEGISDPGKQRHNPELLSKVLELFASEQQAA